MAGARAAAQTGSGCPPLSCDGVETGPFTAPQGWELEPDPRPVAVLSLFNGNHLDPGESTSFRVLHTYGANSPIPGPGGPALLAIAAVFVHRRRRR